MMLPSRLTDYAGGVESFLPPPLPPPHAFVAIKRAVDLLNTDLGRQVSIPELAEEVGYSAAHFTRMFSAVMGVSPNAWLATQRFSVAKSLLIHKQASITDICMGLGFTSLPTFSRRFALEVGVSPSTFTHIVDMLADHPARHLHMCGNTPGGARVIGQVNVPPFVQPGLDIYVGLFKYRSAKGIPETGTLLPQGVTEVVFEQVTPGRYWVLTTAVPAGDIYAQVLPDRPLQGGTPIVVRDGVCPGATFSVDLDHPKMLPAHIVVALPLLTSQIFVDAPRVFAPVGKDGRRIG